MAQLLLIFDFRFSLLDKELKLSLRRQKIKNIWKKLTICWLYLLIYFGSSQLAFSKAIDSFFPPFPDTCTMQPLQGMIVEETIEEDNPYIQNPTYDYLDTYGESSILESLPGKADVILIIHGNSYYPFEYKQLALHLAKNGFIVGVARRQNGYNSNEKIVIDALDTLFAHFELAADSKVGLIGHSVGGRIVVDGAVLNKLSKPNYHIQAIASIAPNIDDAKILNGDHTKDYLLLYGSRDMDMSGLIGIPREAFAAYDQAGTESHTTCTDPVCITKVAPFEKTMIYIHGADHAGLIGSNKPDTFPDNIDRQYLSTSDQFCITKAYVTGFFKWKLKGLTVYKKLLRGKQKPISLAQINSSDLDGYSNPIGSPLRLYTQFTPVQKMSIRNFENGLTQHNYLSSNVSIKILQPGDNESSPYYIRHQTNLLEVGIPYEDKTHFISFKLSNSIKDASNFSHLALRIGLLWHDIYPLNPLSEDRDIWIILYDGTNYEWQLLNWWGKIGIPDPRGHYSDSSAHSYMATIAVPLTAFKTVDLSQIQEVFLAFPGYEDGYFLIDNIEWFRD